MSHTRFALPACLPTALLRCRGCAAPPSPAAAGPRAVRTPAPSVLPGPPRVVRRGAGFPGRGDRPAWQSPYGPPPHRARRRRWAPAPAPVRFRSAVRRGHLCGRSD